MKTYYDLTSKEKKEYLKEFRSTPGGKDIYIGQIIINFIFSVLTLLLVFAYSESFSNYYFFVLLFPVVYDVYVNILFSCWLKNKYDIKRW